MARTINNGRPDAGTDREIDSAGRGKPQPKPSYSKTPNKPPPPGGGKVWDYTNEQWVDMPNLDPRRPWSRTPPGGSRTGDPNERFWHEPGSASGNWNPDYYHWDENGNWVPKPTGRYGMPEDRNGKPIFTPDPVKYPEYFTGSSYTPTQEQQDLWAAREADKKRRLAADPEWAQAKAAGDRRGMMRAELRLKDQYAQEASGMSPEAWKNRFKTSWPVPRSTNGQYWYRPPGANGPNDPGLRGPTPPGVAQGGGDTADALAADMMKSRGKPDVSRETTGRTGGAGGIQGYIPTEDMPPGMTLDIPSQNILSALGSLKPTAKPTRGVRRGGGRVD